nr:hypothetical protein [Tanacetum cinerariifolium]
REKRHDEEEEEDKLYRDVNINQGRGIQTTQEFKDSYVTPNSVNPDGQQQSSSVSSQFVTSMLNLTPDAGMELIFEMTSRMDVLTLTSSSYVCTNYYTFQHCYYNHNNSSTNSSYNSSEHSHLRST